MSARASGRLVRMFDGLPPPGRNPIFANVCAFAGERLQGRSENGRGG
jgi:hypothetical protein